jgi:hypothetical protein
VCFLSCDWTDDERRPSFIGGIFLGDTVNHHWLNLVGFFSANKIYTVRKAGKIM